VKKILGLWFKLRGRNKKAGKSPFKKEQKKSTKKRACKGPRVNSRCTKGKTNQKKRDDWWVKKKKHLILGMEYCSQPHTKVGFLKERNFGGVGNKN